MNHSKTKNNMSRAKLITVALTAATILLAGCNNGENPFTKQTNDPAALTVTGGIQALTRAHDAAWDANDAIGIFMFTTLTTTISEDAENRKYTTADGGGKFTPVTTPTDHTIYFPITGQTDFVAYYPWQSLTKSTGGTYLYAVDVSTQTSQKAIDLMGAGKVVGKDKDHTAVAFEFTHKLVKIALTEIKPGEGLTAADLQGLSVKLTNQYTQATYDVVSGGQVTVNTTTPKAGIALSVAADSRSAEAIVLPAASTAGMELVFALANGNTYTWSLNNATQSTEFKAAHKYNYKIIISKKGLNVTSTITDWVSGNGEGEEGTAQ